MRRTQFALFLTAIAVAILLSGGVAVGGSGPYAAQNTSFEASPVTVNPVEEVSSPDTDLRNVPVGPQATGSGSPLGVEPSLSTTTSTSSDSVEVVVYNFTSGEETRQHWDASETELKDQEINEEEITDTRDWLSEETPHNAWDEAFEPTVSLGSCTGVLVSEYHVLTAGHCVYDEEDDEWDDSVTATPSTDTVGAEPTIPNAEADVVLARTYAPFVDADDASSVSDDAIPGSHDMALLTLDQPVGERTGTANLAFRDVDVDEDIYQDAPVDVTGYPGEPPDPAAPTPSLWRDTGSTTGALCEDALFGTGDCYEEGLTHEVYSSGGQSGSPVVHNRFGLDGAVYHTDEHVVIGVHSGGTDQNDERIRGWGPRLTETRVNHIETWIAYDENEQDEQFTHTAEPSPALGFEGTGTNVPEQWHNWERSEPDGEVMQGEEFVYTPRIVNRGTETFTGYVEIELLVDDEIVDELTVPIDSLEPDESTEIPVRHDIDQEPSAYEFRLFLNSGNGYDVISGGPRHSEIELVVREDGDNWHGTGHSRHATAHNPLTEGPEREGAVQWQSDPIDESVLTSGVVQDGVFFGLDQSGTVHALDARTGDEQWTEQIATDDEVVNEAGLAFGDGQLYVGADGALGDRGTIYAVDPADGSINWQTDDEDLDGRVISDLEAGDGVVYATSLSVLKIDADDGTVDDSYEDIVSPNRLVTYQYQGIPQVIVDGSDGNVTSIVEPFMFEEWSTDITDETLSGATVSENRLFVIDSAGDTLYGVDIGRFDGRAIWEFEVSGEFNFNMEPAVVQDTVYIGDDAGNFHAIDTATGDEAWTEQLGSEIIGIAAAGSFDEETVYVTTRDGDVFALDPDTGDERWHVEGETGFMPPMVADGIVYGTDSTAEGTSFVAISEPPQADFEVSPEEPTAGEEVEFIGSFSDAPTAEIESWDWEFGDGTTASGEFPTHEYAEADEYLVTLTVEDEFGRESTTSETIDVEQPDGPVASFTADPEEVVTGDTVEFDATSADSTAGDLVAYRWDYTGDGEFVADGETPARTYDEGPGTYDVTLEVEDEFGNTDRTTQRIEVELPDEPSASFSVDPERVDRGETIQFDASDAESPDGAIETYRWDYTGNGEFVGDGETSTRTYDEHPGTYDVTLEIEDEFGNTDQTTRSVEVTGTVRVGGDGGEDFEAIQPAIDDADPELVDVIEIHSGSYDERVELTKAVNLIGVDTGDGPPVIDPETSTDGLTISANGLTVENIEVTDVDTVGVVLAGDSVTLQNISTDSGVHLTGEGNQLLDNEFKDDPLEVDTAPNTVESNSFDSTGMLLNRVIQDPEALSVTDNEVNGQPLEYLVDERDVTVAEAGQVYVIDSEDITISGVTTGEVPEAIAVSGSNDVEISDTAISETIRPGIAVEQSDHVTVLDSVLEGTGGVSMNAVSKPTVDGSDVDGIVLTGTTDPTVVRNDIGGLDDVGVFTSANDGTVTINDNTISDVDSGIDINASASDVTVAVTDNHIDQGGVDDFSGIRVAGQQPTGSVENNTVVGSNAVAVDLNGDGLTVHGNELVDGDGGIEVLSTDDAEIRDNRIVNTSDEIGAGGIEVRDSDRVDIVDNDLDSSTEGILVNSGGGHEIADNELAEVIGGILVLDTAEPTVERNHVQGDGHGIVLRSTVEGTVRDNTVRTADGIDLYNSSELVVTQNHVDADSYGIFAEDVTDNTITNNTLESTGVWLQDSARNSLEAIDVSSTDTGVVIVGGEENTLADSTIADIDTGIHLMAGAESEYRDTTVRNTSVSATGFGAVVEQQGVTIEDSTIQADQTGLDAAAQATELTIQESSVTGGASIAGPDAEVSGTTFESDPLRLFDSADATTIENSAFENTGLVLTGDLADAPAALDVVDSTVNGDPLVYLDGVDDREVETAGQVIVVDSTDVTISGPEIERTEIAVRVLDSEGVTVSDVDVTDADAGVVFETVNDAVVTDTHVDDVDTAGIEIRNSEAPEVIGTTIESAPRGIALTGSPNATVNRTMVVAEDAEPPSAVSPQMTIGVEAGSDHATIRETTVDGYDAGITLDATDISVIDTAVQDVEDTGVWFTHGVESELVDSTITGGHVGVQLGLLEADPGTTPAGHVQNTTVAEAETGIEVARPNVGVHDSTVTDTVTGLDIRGENVTVESNTLADNHIGIEIRALPDDPLVGADEVVVTRNVVRDNAGHGIVLEDTRDNLLFDNVFNNTDNYRLVNATDSWNVAEQDAENVVGGSTVGGNYWAHPDDDGFSETASDDENDGIADGAFTLDADNVDELPLADPPATEAFFAIEITGTNSPRQEGETLDVTVEVENTGERAGEQPVTIEIADIDDEQREISVEADETATETFVFDTEGVDPDDYPVTASTEHDTDQTAVTIVDGKTGTIEIIDPPERVPAGEQFDLTIETENASDAIVEFDLGDVAAEYESDSDVVITDDRIEFTDLPSGSSTHDVTVTIAEVPEQTIGEAFAWVNAEERAGAEDTASAEFDLYRPPEFLVDIEVGTRTLFAGDDIELNATVQNVGHVEATQEIGIEFAGDVESTPELTLDANETKTITRTYGTEGLDGDEYQITAFSADDSDTSTVTVQSVDGFLFSINDATDPVTLGQSVAVNTTVEHRGDATETETITLTVDGETVESTPVTLDPDSTTTVTQAWNDTDSVEPATYTLTVAGAAHSETAQITVEDEADGGGGVPSLGPAIYEVQFRELQTDVEPGDTVDIGVRVRNVGDATEDREIVLQADGSTAETTSIQVPSGNQQFVTFTYEVDDDQTGSVPLTVSTDDDTATASLDLIDSEDADEGDEADERDETDEHDETDGQEVDDDPTAAADEEADDDTPDVIDDTVPGFGVAVGIAGVFVAVVFARVRSRRLDSGNRIVDDR